MPRIVWQGFTSATENAVYVDRLVAYLTEIADPGFEFAFSGVDPPDRHLHRLTELRCSVQATAAAIGLAQAGADAIVLGHFQDAGLWDLRSAVDVPVVGLGEASFLHACQLGYRFGVVTISPVFVEWHEAQLRGYALERRCAGVRAMETDLDLWMRAFAGEAEPEAVVERQFEACGQELAAAGAEVLIPAGGLPSLLLGTRSGYAIGGAVVLNANAVAAKQAELAVRLRGLGVAGPCRTGAFRPPPPEALEEFVRLAGA